ncbi:hypothetical protein KR038_003216 [Drosophila bunnanda]|nr:hypothetical protein KR038_003216 [Drosophila bunnanda]
MNTMNVVSRSNLWRVAKRESEKANPTQSMDDYDDTTFEPNYQDIPNSTSHKSVDSKAGFSKNLNLNKISSLSQTQFNELAQAFTCENGSISRLEERMDRIESQIIKLIDTSTKIMTSVRKLSERRSPPKTDFPCKSIGDLDGIEAKVAADQPKYIELFRAMLAPEGVSKNLNRILSTSVLMGMNYAGTCSKTGLTSYVNLNNALYESQRADGYTLGDYAKDVRTAFTKLKNRVYKATNKIKKRRREAMGEDCDADTNFKMETMS